MAVKGELRVKTKSMAGAASGVAALLIVSMGLVMAQKAPKLKPKALQELVESERAFAALGAEKGVQESFFKYFGEEGIAFTPHPAKFRENSRKNPPPNPPRPLQFKLEWWPAYGDVAASGDLGYNTGPTLVTDRTPQNRPASHGKFFSVWKKQAAGHWEVAVDMGVDSPGENPGWQDRLNYTRAPQEKYKAVKRKDAAAGKSEMMALEAAFGKATKSGGQQAYLDYLAPYCLVNRPGRFAIRGKEDAAKYFDEIKLAVVESESIDGSVSKSGELGYTYGRFEVKATRDGTERNVKGYFTHVWKRDAQGDWRLVADVISPLPPPRPVQ